MKMLGDLGKGIFSMMARQEMERTIKLLATCRKAFPQSKADGETLALYARALEPLGYGAIEAAVMRCLRTARFFPTIAEIYDAAESVQRTATNTGGGGGMGRGHAERPP